MKKLLLPSALLLAFAANSMFAASICPAPYSGSVDAEGVSSTYITDTQLSGSQATGTVLNNTGCNVLITFNSNGSITTTFPNAAVSYDSGSDDNLIGIQNNTGSAITSINLSSAVDNIFGFDGDGICGSSSGSQTTTSPGYTFVGGGNPCTHSTDISGYGGPYVSYTNVSANQESGTVNFGNGGIAPGSGSFFSLEGPVDINLAVTSGVPEPATFSLMGIAVCGLFLIRKIRKA